MRLTSTRREAPRAARQSSRARQPSTVGSFVTRHLPWSSKATGAGSKPAGYVHPKAIEVMKEIGIDISGHTSKHMNEFLDKKINTVITVCGNADQACPMFPGQLNRHHWPFVDPAHAQGTEEDILKVFRQVRDEIKSTFEAYGAGRRDAFKNISG